MKSRDLFIEGKNVTRIVKALSNEKRIEILNILTEGECNIRELTEKLGLSKTAVLAHVKLLEETGFITTSFMAGTIGNQKLCKKVYDRLIFDFTLKKRISDQLEYTESITPVGNFFDFDAHPPCGLASKENVIKKWDDPDVFLSNDRMEASLVWTTFGFLCYKLPLPRIFSINSAGVMLEIILEISALGDVVYNSTFIKPEHISSEQITEGISDVTFWVNGQEAGMFTTREISRGDGSYPDKTKYKRERGKYTPKWFLGSFYGEVVEILITNTGTFINGTKTSELTFDDYEVAGSYVDFKIGIKDDAKQISGFNVFGENFGNHPRDIILRLYETPLANGNGI